MKKIGMIGGLGPESTLDYYRLIIEKYRNEVKDGSYPEILINSMDMNILLSFVENKQWDNLVNCLIKGVEILYKAGADFGFISSNTPHIVFERIKELSPIPLISIVEETCKNAEALGIKKIGLIGTKFTMESNFFKKVFDKSNIKIIVPKEEEQDYIHHKLMTEIEFGKFLDETRNGLLNIVKRMIDEDSIEGLILGCTELPLILTKDEFGIPFLNTTKIHVESIIKNCIKES
ncbi:aspartate/glutamate racemase family protein [Clostridium pasteurianum]|jgi:aspartate racemase|uniref:Aspartate racemase n=1 Tax=Clostridium pasteurianum BC1 TaxID=86416 RepID=R4KCP7_CLOPA|nr:amino acid racemase [Clostridium pasteurianum]AGK95387.1 aspartate racemase [Clostridium pasteurianum BC1]AGK95610.1 aspartate racemase [Clostridium pasteurianum BC1]AGK97390.1 aspartate racemase [Clostridium pasteurianum BC1]